jgi:hypothetical protein
LIVRELPPFGLKSDSSAIIIKHSPFAPNLNQDQRHLSISLARRPAESHEDSCVACGMRLAKIESARESFHDVSHRLVGRSEGLLKGLRIGGGINYRGREIIGNHGADLIPSPSNPALSIPDPTASPFRYLYASGFYTGTLTIGYNFKVRKDYRLSLNAKVDNVFNNTEVRHVNQALRPPGGDLTSAAREATPGLYYYLLPRNFQLTSTLSF